MTRTFAADQENDFCWNERQTKEGHSSALEQKRSITKLMFGAYKVAKRCVELNGDQDTFTSQEMNGKAQAEWMRDEF